jgi:hypothetical protein
MSELSSEITPVLIRRDSGLNSQVMGVSGIEELDSIIQDIIDRKAAWVTAAIQAESASYSWPFSDSTLTLLFPSLTVEEKTEIYNDQWKLSADALRYYTLGDLFLKASHRNKAYLDEAKMYWAWGKEVLDALKINIKNATSGGGANSESGGAGLSPLVIILPKGFKNSSEYGSGGC